MRSMTGYGKGIAEKDEQQVCVEMKSVNHKFLDLGIKLPRQFNSKEDFVRQTVGGIFKRGHIDIYINYKNNKQSSKISAIDKNVVEAFFQGSKSARNSFSSIKQFRDFQVGALLKCGDLFLNETEEEPIEILEDLLQTALLQACEQLLNMRTIEGLNIKEDLEEKIQEIDNCAVQIKQLVPQITTEYHTKLLARIKILLQDVQVDESKLINEVAFFVDKSNIDEELIRLKSHIEQIIQLFKLEEPIGRRLDFLVQELNREVNTICSKANNISLTNLGLCMKNEIEKIREQIQNIE